MPSPVKKSRSDPALPSPRRRTENIEKTKTYCDGAITRIILTNFMTHQKFDWEPGCHVNLITGPNGSGKSSILQAIVIGLGKRFASVTRNDANLNIRVRCNNIYENLF